MGGQGSPCGALPSGTGVVARRDALRGLISRDGSRKDTLLGMGPGEWAPGNKLSGDCPESTHERLVFALSHTVPCVRAGVTASVRVISRLGSV